MGNRLAGLKRYPEFFLMGAGVLAFYLIRDNLAPISPQLTVFWSFFLFLLPGIAVVCLLGSEASLIERLALAFVGSLALSGIPALVVMFVHTNITVFTTAFLAITGFMYAIAFLRLLLAPPKARTRIEEADPDHTAWWLAGAMMVVTAGLVIFTVNSPADGDQWNIAAWIQNIRNDPHMMVEEPIYGVGFPVPPRYLFSTWLVQQAMMSQVSNVDPSVQFLFLRLPMMLLSLAAIYLFGYELTKRKDAAAIIFIVWAIYLMLWNEGTVPGYEILVRADLDKDIAAFNLLPVGLVIIMQFVGRGSRRDWIWLIMFSIAAALMHPISMMFIGLALSLFSVLELLATLNAKPNRIFGRFHLPGVLGRINPGVFWRLAFSAFVLLAGAVPATIAAAQMNSFGVVPTGLNDVLADPGLPRRIGYTLDMQRMLILDNGWYIIHPRMVFQILHMLAYLGLPILAMRSRQDRASRLLLSMLIVFPVIDLFPPTAMILGRLVTPALVYRFAWPISVAAVAAVGWGIWAIYRRVVDSFSSVPVRAVASLAITVVALVLVVPPATSSEKWLAERDQSPTENFCKFAAPLLTPLQKLAAGNTFVLAEEDVDQCLTSYAPYVSILEFRWTNAVRYYPLGKRDTGWQRLYDSSYFSQADLADAHLFQIIDRWGAKYLIVRLDSPLETQLRHLPSFFQPVETALNRRVYAVVSPHLSSPIVDANTLLVDQHWNEAIAAYQKLVNGDADTRLLAYIGLGKAYLETGKLDQAIAAWQQAAAGGTESLPYALLGDAFIVKDNLSAAAQSYESAIAIQPENDAALNRLGVIYGQQGRVDDATKMFSRSLARLTDPNSLLYYQALGQKLLEVNAYNAALKQYELASADMADKSNDLLMGQLYQAVQQYDVAEQYYHLYTVLDPWDALGSINLGNLYRDREMYDQAMAQYRTAIRLNAMTSEPYDALIQLWSNQQGYQAALSNLKSLVGYRLGFGTQFSQAAALDAGAGRLDLAFELDQQAINWQPQVPDFWQALGTDQLAAGSRDQALQTFRRAREQGSQQTKVASAAYGSYAQIYRELGQNDISVGMNWEAIRSEPTNPGVYSRLGSLMQDLGQNDKALALFQKAIALDPMKSGPHITLGYYYQRQGDTAQAEEQFLLALKQGGGVSAHQALGELYQVTGNLTKAEAEFQKAVKATPGKGESHVALGNLYLQMGEQDKALAELKKSVQVAPGFARAYADLSSAYLALDQKQAAQDLDNAAIINLPYQDLGYQLLGQYYEQAGNPASAESSYRQAIAKLAAPNTTRTLLELGKLYERQGTFSPAQAATQPAIQVQAAPADNYSQAEASVQAAIKAQPTQVDAYVQLVNLLTLQGQWKRASDAAQSGLTVNPGSALLLTSLGDVSVQQGNVQKGIEQYQQALALEPSFQDADIALADLYQRLGQPDKAIGVLEKAQALQPGNIKLQYTRANLYQAEGQADKAAAAALAVKDLASGDIRTWITLGDVYTFQGQFDKALEAYRQATTRAPGAFEAWLALGKYQMLRGQMGDAKDALGKSVQADLSQVEPHLALADLAARTGAQADAISEYLKASALDLSRDQALLQLGQIAQQMGKLDDAAKWYDQAIGIVPIDSGAYKAKSSVALDKGQFDQARQVLTRATIAAPGSCDAFLNLGSFVAGRGEAANAEQDYFKARGLPGCATTAPIALGNLYLARNRVTDAINQFNQAVAAQPGDPFAYVVLADTYMSQMRWSDAMGAYQDAIARVPASDVLYDAQGRALQSQDKLKEGKDAIQNASNLRPSNALDYISLGRAFQVLGQNADAEKAFKQAAAANQSLPDPWMALGDLYTQQSRFDDALAAYKRAVDVAPGQPRPYESLANYYETRNQSDLAVAAYKQAASANQSQVTALLLLGKLYQRNANPTDAEQIFRQAASLGVADAGSFSTPAEYQTGITAPSSAQAYIALGNLRRSQADPVAEQMYKKAIEIAPADPVGYINLGQAYQAQGRPNDAAAQFHMAVKVNPRSAQAFAALGDLYGQQDNSSAAQDAYLKAISVQPASALGYLSLGKFFQTQANQGTALNQYQTGTSAVPSSGRVYASIAELHRSRADWAAAQDAYNKALQVTPSDWNSIIGLGKTYQALGKYPEALAQYQKATQIAPAASQAFNALGDLYRAQADWKNAEQAYNQAIKADPASPLGYVGLGLNDQAQYMLSDAQSEFQVAIKAAPAAVLGYSSLGDLYRIQGNWTDAERIYQQAIKVDSTNPASYLGLGKIYLAQGRAAQAWDQYQAALKAVPAAGDIYSALGDYYQALGDWKNAQQNYKQAIRVTPDSPLGYIGLAQTYHMQGLSSQALAQYQEAVRSAPAVVDSYLALADWYNTLADWKNAQQTYNQAVQALPASSRALAGLGDWYELQGDLKNAEQMYNQAIRAVPSDVNGYIQLARLYQRLGRSADAGVQYLLATKVDPGSASAFVALGDFYTSQANVKSAMTAYQQAIKVEPANPAGYLSLSQSYQLQGKQPEAVAAYQAAATAIPGNAELYVNMGNYDLDRGALDAAVTTFQQALKLEPGNIQARVGLGRAFEWQTLFSKAEQTIKDTVAMAPGSVAGYSALGEFYTGREEWAKATAAYQQALRVAPTDTKSNEGLIGVDLLTDHPDQGMKDALKWESIAGPGDERPLISVARLKQTSGDFAGAIAIYQPMIDHTPGIAEAYVGKAQALKSQGQQQDAVNTLNVLLGIQPNAPTALLSRGESWEVLGKFDNAQSDYHAAAVLDASSAVAYMSEAKMAIAAGNMDQGIRLYQQAIAAQPTKLEPYTELADIFNQLKQNQNAVNTLRPAVQLVRPGIAIPATSVLPNTTNYQQQPMPDALRARISLAEALAGNSDEGGALGVMQSALPLFPKNEPIIVSEQGTIFGQFSQYDQAHQFFAKAIAEDPNLYIAYLDEGDVYFRKQGKNQQAIDSYEKAAQINGQQRNIYLKIFKVYRNIKLGRPSFEYDPATCPMLPRLVGCDITNVYFHTALDGVLKSKIEQSLAENPNSVDLSVRMAVFYGVFSLGDPSIQGWKNVLKLDPGNPDAYLDLGRLYSQKEDSRLMSADYVGRYLALGPNVQEAHDLLYYLHHNHITSPLPSAVLNGSVAITGTADGTKTGAKTDYDYYRVEIGAGATPTAWTQIFLTHNAVDEGVLGVLDTTKFSNGTYTIRLVVVDKSGNYSPWHAITIEIKN